MFEVSADEMKASVGMNSVMSYHVFPSFRSYWSVGVEIMPLYIFDGIRRYLHFSNNEEQSSTEDQTSKMTIVMNHFNASHHSLSALSATKTQSVDDLVIKLKGHIIKNKLIK